MGVNLRKSGKKPVQCISLVVLWCLIEKTALQKLDEHDIIDGIINSNRDSFKTLVDTYQSIVLNTCNSFLHDPHLAEDLTQEVFIEVYLSIQKFKKDARLSTWIYRIAVNKSLNYIRDHKKQQIIKSMESMLRFNNTDKLEEDAKETHEEQLKLMYESIDSLPKKQKTVITLCKLENLTYKEVAEIMEVPITTIEGLMHRAKKNLRKKFLKKNEK